MSKGKIAGRGIGDLQRSMERFETYNDGFILPDTRLVLRLDAHRLGDWSALADEYPTGPQITETFHETAINLMMSSFRVKVAFVQGDEISLFLDPAENTNPLRRSSIISSFSSAAAIHFLKASGLAATFNARLSELPSTERLIEYFLWQRRYCYRNAITILLRRTLLANGMSPAEAEAAFHGVPEGERIAQLTQMGVSSNSLPKTTLRGALFAWKATSRDPSHVAIARCTSLPDDDQEFVQLITTWIASSGRLGAEDYGPEATLTSTHTPLSAPSKKPDHKLNRKTNVSVFKVPSAPRG